MDSARILVPYLFLFVFLFSCSPDKPKEVAGGSPTTAFKIKRGTNIAHWLSQVPGQKRIPFTRKDIAFIDSVGFDHIRLPIDEDQMWDESGKRHEDAFKLLEDCITWCHEAGLRMVLDLHILRSHHFNANEKPLWTKPEEQDKFIALWKDLSAAVHEWPNEMLAYEFMNEPVADDPEQWNILLARVADSIRSWEPERVLVIGSNRWQSASTFDKLRVPENDKNIILSFHFYEPFHLTHYQAGWSYLKDFKGEVKYPGQVVVNGSTYEEKRVYTIDTLEHMMQMPLALASRLNLPLYCGEFGVIERAPVPDKLAWYRDMVKIFEKHGIAYANWNYKAGAFGIVDNELEPDMPMIEVLVSKKFN